MRLIDLPGGPYALVTGPDSALWVTLVHAGQIARVDLDGGITRHQVEPATCQPSQITVGPDGALWFTAMGADLIGRITVDGDLSTFPAPGGPYGITAGADGALWFTAMTANSIGRITLGGTVTETELPVAGAFPSMISTAPDGALWFTLNQANAIGRLRPGGRPEIVDLSTDGSGPVGIDASGDQVWFAQILAGQVGTIDGDMRITEFRLPDRAARPHAVLADGSGCLVTEWAAARLARIASDGSVQHVDLPPGSEPHGLTRGPDGAIWVALESGYLLGV